MRPVFAALLVLCSACRGTLSPLSNRIDIGQEPYFVFAGDGEDGVGDLFASEPAGGEVWQVTFSRVDEGLPSLSPDGVLLAFSRGRAPGDTGGRSVVLLNLLNGAEREVIPPGVLEPRAIGWSEDGRRILVGSGETVLAVPAPPARGAPAEADSSDRSALAVRVGGATGARARNCTGWAGACLVLPDGREVILDADARSPAPWFGDSVVYQRGDAWIVHPLAGGRTRTLSWPTRVMHPRSLTMFRGRR